MLLALFFVCLVLGFLFFILLPRVRMVYMFSVLLTYSELISFKTMILIKSTRKNKCLNKLSRNPNLAKCYLLVELFFNLSCLIRNREKNKINIPWSPTMYQMLCFQCLFSSVLLKKEQRCQEITLSLIPQDHI